MVLRANSSPAAGGGHVPSPADPYLPLRDLADYSGLSVRTLRGFLRTPANSLPHFRVRGRILVRRSDFDAWMLAFRRIDSEALNGLIDDVLSSLRIH